jgi:hypothetical protein
MLQWGSSANLIALILTNAWVPWRFSDLSVLLGLPNCLAYGQISVLIGSIRTLLWLFVLMFLCRPCIITHPITSLFSHSIFALAPLLSLRSCVASRQRRYTRVSFHSTTIVWFWKLGYNPALIYSTMRQHDCLEQFVITAQDLIVITYLFINSLKQVFRHISLYLWHR